MWWYSQRSTDGVVVYCSSCGSDEVDGSRFCSVCGTAIDSESRAVEVPPGTTVAVPRDVADIEPSSEAVMPVDIEADSSVGRLFRVWLIGGVAAVVVLLVAGAVFVLGRDLPGPVTVGEGPVSGSAVAVSVGSGVVTLVSGFPSNFPVPSGAELISSFSGGSDETEVLTAVWSVDGDLSEVAGWYEQSLADGWGVVERGVALFGSASFRLSDDAGEFPQSGLVFSQIGELTQVAVTLASDDLYAGVGSVTGSDFSQIPLGVPDPVVPPELPQELVIDGARVVDASALPDGAIVTVRFSVDLAFDQAVAWYDEVVEGLGGDTTSTSEDGATVLTWDSAELSGLVVIVESDPVDVFVMVRR